MLREQLRGRRLRSTDVQRRGLALVAAKCDGTTKRGRSQPRRTHDIVQVVLRTANSNPTWGYTRIRGALSNLAHAIGRNTIRRILRDAGITPAPERSKRKSWSAHTLDNKLIVAPSSNAAVGGKILRRKRLGGALTFYHRGAG